MESSPKPLEVIIVGAGIGGLTTAIELRRNGHNVSVFEQSRFIQEYGAAIHLAPNANGLLKRIGIDMADHGAIPTEMISEGDKHGHIVKTIQIGQSKDMWQHGFLFCHRATLHNQLKEAALDPQLPGKPVKLATSAKVDSIDTETTTITLLDGTKYNADVIIGADGVHSRLRKALVHSGEGTKPSSKSSFRFLIDKQMIKAKDPAAYELIKRGGELISFYDLDRRVVIFPGDNNEVLNLACLHPDELSEASDETWGRQGNKERMLEIYTGWDERIRAIMSMADDKTLKVWKLLDMNPLQSWTQGRLCLLGDAAHPFLPYNGQGAACAIEDAGSLGVMLCQGVTAEQVTERIKLYEHARMKRAHQLQEFSRVAGRDLTPDAMDSAGKVMARLAAFAYGHDEYHNSTQVLREHLQKSATEPLHWRSPIGFGPAPAPQVKRVSTVLNTRVRKFTQTTVRFKTSRTLLQNFLPRPDVLSFASPGTVIEASWVYEEEARAEASSGWAGRNWSLLVHNVKCQPPNQSSQIGDFMVLRLDDDPDAVVRDREQFGLPTFLCSSRCIDDVCAEEMIITATYAGCPVVAELAINGLIESESTEYVAPSNPKSGWGPPAPPHGGIFVHRYIPSLGATEPGDQVPDADYIACLPSPQTMEQPKWTSVRWSSSAIVHLPKYREHMAWFPHLYHVTERIAELPIIGIVKVTVCKGEVSEHGRRISKVPGTDRTILEQQPRGGSHIP